MKNQWLTIKQLDRQLKEWQALAHRYGRPKAGWIKTVRTALGMPAKQFADRISLTESRVHQLETAETNDAVTLKTLRMAANALGCELVYTIVPKGNDSLESIIRSRAEKIADERISQVAHTMSLESQSVDPEMLEVQKDELIRELIGKLNKRFWATNKPKNKNDLRNALINKLKKER